MDELQSRLRTSLQQFFAEELPDLRVVHVDDQKVVVEEVTSGLRVVASWLQLVATQLQPIRRASLCRRVATGYVYLLM